MILLFRLVSVSLWRPMILQTRKKSETIEDYWCFYKALKVSYCIGYGSATDCKPILLIKYSLAITALFDLPKTNFNSIKESLFTS